MWAEGLPVEAWAAAAQARLSREPAVERAEVAAGWELDEVELTDHVAVMSVDVVVHGDEPEVVAALVRDVVAAALRGVGDGEPGWTAYDWEAIPADSQPGRAGPE